MRRALSLGAFLAILFAILGTGTSARAAATFENITVDNSQAPKQLTFKVTLSAPADITEATLRFRVAGRASSGIGQPADPITPARNLTVSVVMQTNTAGNYIPRRLRHHLLLARPDRRRPDHGKPGREVHLPPHRRLALRGRRKRDCLFPG
ncbi:MAG: hypothetical protein IPG47_17760 [Thermoflexaceae bacterium]|nr:hypothetical protein [Thermoflexaceae bacterium]